MVAECVDEELSDLSFDDEYFTLPSESDSSPQRLHNPPRKAVIRSGIHNANDAYRKAGEVGNALKNEVLELTETQRTKATYVLPFHSIDMR
jgi:hypothetical protein